MMTNQIVGEEFVGYPDEHLRSMLRPGTLHGWGDARPIGKAPGQPVLFLQTRERGAAWVGSGVIRRVAERWKALGLYVETRAVLARPLATATWNPDGDP